MVLPSSAATLWQADDGIPTGERVPVPTELDFRTPKPVGGLVLDRLFTDLGLDRAKAGELVEVARLAHRSAPAGTREHYRQSQQAFYEKHHPGWAPLLRLYVRIFG